MIKVSGMLLAASAVLALAPASANAQAATAAERNTFCTVTVDNEEGAHIQYVSGAFAHTANPERDKTDFVRYLLSHYAAPEHFVLVTLRPTCTTVAPGGETAADQALSMTEVAGSHGFRGITTTWVPGTPE